jgi:hypothetical protein
VGEGAVEIERSGPIHRARRESEQVMIRSTASKVMWVGRATVFLVGLSVILALVFGVATTAMGANGNPFLLGKRNVASAISTLVKQGPGPALNLVVRAGQPPMAVNATAGKATNLNADKVDGQSFACPGGTLFHEGVCIETTKRAFATFSTAQDDCLGEGRRLPSPEELQTFRNRSGHDFKGNVEFTSEINFSSSSASPIVLSANLGYRLQTNQESVWEYRCAVPPS